jgi:beta-phosphoglucomutase-like phosphatase (HAD superfamily)
VPAKRAIVVEDSRNGLLAAVGAGLSCLVTVNEITAGEDFAEAAMVVSSLGDPDNGGEPTVLIANHSPAPPPGDQITLADLAGLLPDLE